MRYNYKGFRSCDSGCDIEVHRRSYNQFMVYDESVRDPGSAWTEEHAAQGFAQRQSTVNFGTPLEFGYANVTVSLGALPVSDARSCRVPTPARGLGAEWHLDAGWKNSVHEKQ